MFKMDSECYKDCPVGTYPFINYTDPSLESNVCYTCKNPACVCDVQSPEICLGCREGSNYIFLMHPEQTCIQSCGDSMYYDSELYVCD